jgi:hypothetical protein
MYLATGGQWMEEDPDGFAAGDANLRRIVRNDPTNTVDPSGLDGEFLGGLADLGKPEQPENEYTLRNTVGYRWEKSYEPGETDQIIKATSGALVRVQKAYLAIRHYRDEIETDRGREDPDRFLKPISRDLRQNQWYDKLFSQVKTQKVFVEYDHGNQFWHIATVDLPRPYTFVYAHYWQALTKLHDYLMDRKMITFVREKAVRDPGKEMGGPAYIIPTTGDDPPMGAPIHINNVFFDVDPFHQVSTIRHELGRWSGWNGADATRELLSDVQEWDSMVDYLADQYDRWTSHYQKVR